MPRWSAVIGLSLATACTGGSRELAPIVLDSLPTLGATTGEGVLTSWPRVSPLHADGFRVLVPQPGGNGEVPLAFGADGGLIGPVGTRGTGPGLLAEPLFARVGPGDSLWIFDGTARALVYGADRGFGREVALPVAPWDAAFLADGRLVVASASSRAPLPVLLLTQSGEVVREIGTAPPGEPLGTMRRIAIGPDGTIWTMAVLGSWRVERWDTTGASLGEMVREPAWFPPYDSYQPPAPGVPPQPALQSFWFDSAGRLWVLGKAADPAWADGVGALDARGGDEGTSVITDPDRVYDTVLEVIDPATGELLATTRLDIAWPFTAEPGTLMRVVTTPEGWHRAAMATVRMNGEQ